MTAPGRLVLVATPIGNLGDLAPRAVETLSAADLIVCEDTRRTRKLLTHAGIARSELIAVHGHNERAQVRTIMSRLSKGALVAMVSDAGMPAISDPGQRVVAAAAQDGYRVEVVPGPSAAVAALAISGLNTDRYCFEGFLPRRGRERKERLSVIAAEPRTTVLYESPHRMGTTIDDLADACGPYRRVAIARELTKIYEEVWRGTLEQAARRASEVEPRGEYVIVLDGARVEPATDDVVEDALRARLDSGEDRKTAVGEVAEELSVPKRRVYEAALRLKE